MKGPYLKKINILKYANGQWTVLFSILEFIDLKTVSRLKPLGKNRATKKYEQTMTNWFFTGRVRVTLVAAVHIILIQ